MCSPTLLLVRITQFLYWVCRLYIESHVYRPAENRTTYETCDAPRLEELKFEGLHAVCRVVGSDCGDFHMHVLQDASIVVEEQDENAWREKLCKTKQAEGT